MRNLYLVLCASTMLCAVPATAATIVQTVTGGPAYAAKFNANAGKLNSVSVSASYDFTAYFSYPFELGTPLVSAVGTYGGSSLASFDFTGSYRSFTENPLVLGINVVGTAMGSTTENLDMYIGDGTVPLAAEIATTATFSANAVPLMRPQSLFPAISRDRYTITYDFTPTALPEPGSWAFMLAGFGMIGCFLRRRTVPLVTPIPA